MSADEIFLTVLFSRCILEVFVTMNNCEQTILRENRKAPYNFF